MIFSDIKHASYMCLLFWNVIPATGEQFKFIGIIFPLNCCECLNTPFFNITKYYSY
jgi:hypothetical protein